MTISANRFEQQTPPKWLIIQLARFGDLMQTVPLILSAKRMKQSPEIHLLAAPELSDLGKMIDGISRVFSAERQNWLKFSTGNGNSLINWASKVKSMIEPLRDEHYQKVINITHTRESAFLSQLIESEEICGLSGDRYGVSATNEWESYFHKILADRSKNQINLVDIHLKIAGLPLPRSNGKLRPNPRRAQYYKSLLKSEVDRDLKLIALQLGANSPLRQWSVSDFLRTTRYITQRVSAKFVLVGDSKEVNFASEFMAGQKANIVNLVGKTSLTDLAAVIDNCDIMIGADTGSVHLAAALQVPTVSIFLGMARPQDTAPYGEGHIVFHPQRECYPCIESSTCKNPICKSDILADKVGEAVTNLLCDNNQPIEHAKNYKCYRTEFAVDGFQILSPRIENNTDQMNVPKIDHTRVKQHYSYMAGSIS